VVGPAQVAAGGKLNLRVRDNIFDCGRELRVRRGPTCRNVVRAMAQPLRQLQEGDGSSAVPYIAQIDTAFSVGGRNAERSGRVPRTAAWTSCGAAKDGEAARPSGPQTLPMRTLSHLDIQEPAAIVAEQLANLLERGYHVTSCHRERRGLPAWRILAHAAVHTDRARIDDARHSQRSGVFHHVEQAVDRFPRAVDGFVRSRRPWNRSAEMDDSGDPVTPADRQQRREVAEVVGNRLE
jgi:hypothetical protein